MSSFLYFSQLFKPKFGFVCSLLPQIE